MSTKSQVIKLLPSESRTHAYVKCSAMGLAMDPIGKRAWSVAGDNLVVRYDLTAEVSYHAASYAVAPLTMKISLRYALEHTRQPTPVAQDSLYAMTGAF